MRYTILFALFTMLLVGCKKDKFTTVPQLKYKSVNTNVLGVDQVIHFYLDFTDAEGDIDSVYIQKITSSCPASNIRDSTEFSPDVPQTKNQHGELIISYANGINSFPYTTIAPLCPDQNDTCYFRFYAKDKKKNVSDTITSEQIVIIKN
ncbi:MAG: hypothetical protein V4556_09430 [Bacteroidota bacterium]